MKTSRQITAQVQQSEAALESQTNAWEEQLQKSLTEADALKASINADMPDMERSVLAEVNQANALTQAEIAQQYSAHRARYG
jgi:hypothetical protein